jgi:hypothetical protein
LKDFTPPPTFAEYAAQHANTRSDGSDGSSEASSAAVESDDHEVGHPMEGHVGNGSQSSNPPNSDENLEKNKDDAFDAMGSDDEELKLMEDLSMVPYSSHETPADFDDDNLLPLPQWESSYNHPLFPEAGEQP